MRSEIGSEFHWDPAVLTGGGNDLPAGRLFATGCGALSELLRMLGPAGRLHVPSYFCMGVAEALSERTPIAWYRHLPDGRGPRWETLRVRDGDVVLAQNLFGREGRQYGPLWRAWIRAHPGIPVIEDHSHDPISDWARRSEAAYAVASLRKTLPVPDGGLLWSPRGLPLPSPRGPESTGAHLKLAAMLLKAAWRDGRPIDKEQFRSLQQQGEHELLGSHGPACAFTRAALPVMDVAGIRAAGRDNVREVERLLSTRTGQGMKVWGDGPFRLQLECPTSPVRDALQAHLADHRIYAPVHWRQERGRLWSGDHDAAELAGRFLTLPVDHRCGPGDLSRIAEVVQSFAPALAA
ncbi:hypothetical protein ACTI_82870 [Actinoplanes sp. OR16]|uniref:hypothetical protein n=1 Tax=Actinoplanes sp. OR16 TaxID=946334 RepID=UPI000F6EDE18|nr:hypothetical protein [Actinoplanes sp. OR16]BBH71602.1 hypothetical protein ACTI_82870 [Actinoplanes sp. OR16]